MARRSMGCRPGEIEPKGGRKRRLGSAASAAPDGPGIGPGDGVFTH